MPEIRVTDFTGREIEKVLALTGMNLADVMMSNWPTGFDATILVCNHNIVFTDDEVCNYIIQSEDDFEIRLLPNAQVALTTWILLAASVATLVLLRPSLPSAQQNTYEWDDSDRPQFYSGQQNQVQPGRRVPDLFGEIRHYPDLLSLPAIEYFGNTQTIRELYVISRGDFDVLETYFFDEGLQDQTNADIEIYKPGDRWPLDFPIMRANSAVADIELPGPNETISTGVDFVLSGNSITVAVPDYFTDFVDQVGSAFLLTGTAIGNHGPHFVTGISPDGQTLNIAPAWDIDETINDGSASFVGLSWVALNGANTPAVVNINEWRLVETNNRTYELAYDNNDNLVVVPTKPPDNFRLLKRNNRNKYKVIRTVDGSVTVKNGIRSADRGDVDEGNHWAFKQISDSDFDPNVPGTGYASGIFNVPGMATEAWLEFEFPQGLYKQTAGETPNSLNVKVEVNWRERNVVQAADANWNSVEFNFNEKTRTPRRFTQKIKFPRVGKYELYCRRVTDFRTDTASKVYQDAVMWVALYGRQDVSSLSNDILDVTLADVRLNSQGLRVSGQSRRFNVVGIRKLYDYRNEVFTTTQKMSDAIMHTLVEMGNIPRANIDEASLYAIQDDLDAQGGRDGEFSGVVDQTMTVDDQVRLIADLSRTTVYRRGGTFYFTRLKANETPSTLINARNKIEPERRNFSLAKQNEPDAVILRYQNRDDFYRETSLQYPPNVTPVTPEEQTILGLCTEQSVKRLAAYLWNKNVYERDAISINMTEEGSLLGPGDVMAVTDFLMEKKPIEGEILNISGNSVTFDEVIPVGTWMARVRDDLGELVKNEQLTITMEGKVQTIPEWSDLVMPAAGSTVGLLYSIEEIQTNQRDLFYVTSVQPDREGAVTVEGVLYRNETYAGDEL